MSTQTRRDKNAAEELANDYSHIERRTVRAVRESMAVDAYRHGEGTGMFDVHSASGSVYTIDLRRSARGERACTCPDAQYNLSHAERCKHERRVRMMLGIDDVPVVLLDARDPTLKANMKKFGAEPSVEAQAAQVAAMADERAERVMTDGGTVDGCPHDDPDCERGEGKERPVLCWSCWEVTA